MAKNDSWWVKISVSLTDHFVWNGEPFTRGQAWVDLILLVNHEPTKAVIDGQVIEVGIGEYVTSIRRLADRWNRSTKWVMDYLELLRSDNMIQTRVIGHGKNSKTLLFLVNYAGFQLSGNVKETHRKRIENAKETQDGGKGVLNNNIYNTPIENGEIKNKENITPNNINVVTPKGGEKESKKRFVKPTLEEVDAYCRERGNNIDPQAFIDNYERVGWVVGKNKTPMKDWKATVRTWEHNNFKTDKRKESPPVRDENFVDLSEYF